MTDPMEAHPQEATASLPRFTRLMNASAYDCCPLCAQRIVIVLSNHFDTAATGVPLHSALVSLLLRVRVQLIGHL